MQNTVALCCSCRPRDKSVQDPDIKLDQSESRLQSDIPTGLFHRSPGQSARCLKCCPIWCQSCVSDIKCVCVMPVARLFISLIINYFRALKKV